MLLLTGEAGIGKSALVRELVSRARSQRLQVCVGRCHEAELAPAYWPWLPVLGELAGDDAPREVTALLGGGNDVEAVHADAAALRTYDAAARVLGAVSSPLVVVLEDLHWSDVSSLRMLAYAAEALRDRPVLFVVTVRSEASPRPALTEALAGFSRLGARRLALSPLGIDEVAALVAAVIGDAGPELVAVLSRRSDGNPFFALEMARLLAAQGELNAAAAEALVVPDGIADVLRLRFQRLDDPVRETLSIAAVLGRDFDAGLIAAAAGRPVLDDLDEAMAAGRRPRRRAARHRPLRARAGARDVVRRPPGRPARPPARGRGAGARRTGCPARTSWSARSPTTSARAAVYLPDLLDQAVEHTAERSPFGRAPWCVRGGARAVAAGGRARRAQRAGHHRAPPPPAAQPGLAADAPRRHGRHAGVPAARRSRTPGPRATTSGWPRRRPASGAPTSGTGGWSAATTRRRSRRSRSASTHVEDLGLRARLLANLGLEHYVAWRPDLSDPPLWESLEVARRSGDAEVLRDCLAAREMTLWGPGMHVQRAECAREHLTLGLSPELAHHRAVPARLRRSTTGVTAQPRTRPWPRRSRSPRSSDAPVSTCRSRSGAGCVPTRRPRPTPTTSPRSPSSCTAARASCRTRRSVAAPGSPRCAGPRCPTTWWSWAPATPTSASGPASPTRSP